jgi:hypothetical protein|tara:strand:+ start:2273 stop:2989 length:717 start_codon:yes stop_codon:yes gene_type:complete
MKKTILNHEYIENSITKNNGKDDVKYRWSHGATDKHMGDGMILYSMMYFFKPTISVCLGSGGGYIPRIMWSCISDLEQEGFNTDEARVILVDAVNGVNGQPDWTDEDSFYRKKFLSEWLHTTTEKAYYEYFVKRDMKIDMLWIDADHTYEGIQKDFKLYSQIMSDKGIIIIHDTDKDYVDNFIETKEHEDYDLSGPSEWLRRFTIGWQYDDYEVLNLFNYGIEKDFPSSTGLTILRKK